MVDSKAKGALGEKQVKELLAKHTGLNFQRVPHSGALTDLKGDLWVPREKNFFCIEVKFYLDSHFNDKVFTSKSNNWVSWWTKIVDQAKDMGQDPLLFFKYNRSKIFVTTFAKPLICRYMYVSWLNAYVCVAEEWLTEEDIVFIK